jgi:hypothetical protein
LERSFAKSVTIENNPSRTGVVRRIALSDHWRWVYFNLPATDEPGEDVSWISIEIGCQECLRLEFALGIADEKPTDRHRPQAAAIPQRGAGADLHEAVGSAVPEIDAVVLPGDIAILEDGGQLFMGLALDRGPPRPLRFCGGKPNKLASRRKRVTTQTWLRTADNLRKPRQHEAHAQECS